MKKIVILSFAFASALLLGAGTASAAPLHHPHCGIIAHEIRAALYPAPVPHHYFAGTHYHGDGCSAAYHRKLLREWREDHH